MVYVHSIKTLTTTTSFCIRKELWTIPSKNYILELDKTDNSKKKVKNIGGGERIILVWKSGKTISPYLKEK